jgi:hypothetical protein
MNLKEPAMKHVPYCYGGRVAVAFGLLFSLASFHVSSMATEDAANTKAETAGERAHFAQEFCEVPAERVGAYKERLRKALHGADNFDLRWQAGWRRAENGNSQMRSLRERDSEEFAARVKVNCERLKWMAQNSLRPPARK